MGFSRRKILRSIAYTISEKAIRQIFDFRIFRFRHPDYDQDRAQNLISSSMSRHLTTRNISFKSMHVFLSNLANRQTDRQTNIGKTFTSSFVGGNNYSCQFNFLSHLLNVLFLSRHSHRWRDRLSVTRRECVKTTDHRIIHISPSGSTRTVVFLEQRLYPRSQRLSTLTLLLESLAWKKCIIEY